MIYSMMCLPHYFLILVTKIPIFCKLIIARWAEEYAFRQKTITTSPFQFKIMLDTDDSVAMDP